MNSQFVFSHLGIWLIGGVLTSPISAIGSQALPGQESTTFMTDIRQVARHWSMDHSTFNPSVQPCEDFYEHVCGGWDVPSNIPPDKLRAQWAMDLANKANDLALKELLSGSTLIRDPEVTRLRLFFNSCMSQDAKTQRAARATLSEWLKRIDDMKRRDQLLPVLSELHAHGVNAFFQYSGQPDRADKLQFRGEISQGTMGLRRAAYSEKGSDADERRRAYHDHIARMLILSGIDSVQAHRQASVVLNLELALSAASLSFSDQFDPTKSEHPLTREALTQLSPNVDWVDYLKMVGAPPDRSLNVASPEYLRTVDLIIADTPLIDLRAFLRWQFLSAFATALPTQLRQEDERYMAQPGTSPQSRFEKCKLETIKSLGIELSEQYSLRFVGPETRAKAREVAERLRAEVITSAAAIEWLSPAGRAASEQRVRQLDLKVGYPDQWPATGSFHLDTHAFLANVINARAFEQQRSWARAKGERHRESWEMTVYPNGVPGMAAARLVIPNGYPDVFTNSIVLTSAWLRAPLFDAEAPPEVRYGTFGTLVGHELGHVLENHEYDANGESNDSWSKTDIDAHQKQSECIVEQANQYSTLDGQHFDGRRTVDENVADLSGVVHAYAAMVHELGSHGSKVGDDGLTADQRFFIAYAQQLCIAERPEYARQSLREDGHGPNRFRVNGPLSNMPEFAHAFACSANSPMVKPAASRCSLWGLVTRSH